jgi:predicted DNA-binding protein (MmcQ/YjbR family)
MSGPDAPKIPKNVHERELRAFALSFPGAYEEFPWGERVVKVNKKIFVFLGRGESGSVGCAVKLPKSRGTALTLDECSPTGYGLGKSGWVDAKFTGKKPPMELLKEWIEESYRAVAPVKLVKELDAMPGVAPARKKRSGKGR